MAIIGKTYDFWKTKKLDYHCMGIYAPIVVPKQNLANW